jgi:hypothetical protein
MIKAEGCDVKLRKGPVQAQGAYRDQHGAERGIWQHWDLATYQFNQTG